jgi:hypothetical protein
MKTLWKVLEMHGLDDFEFFFPNKKTAIKWLGKEIKRREAGDKDGVPMRDGWDDKIENRLTKLIQQRKWEKLAPYYRLYLSKHQMITKV